MGSRGVACPGPPRGYEAIQKGELRVVRRRRPQIGKTVLENFATESGTRLTPSWKRWRRSERPSTSGQWLSKCAGARYNTRCERKYIGGKPHYRMFPQEKLVSIGELTDKLRPLIEGLKVEGKKNMATISISVTR
jgi:hypothetical protein